jgi:ABC-type phosphate transport system substrate-binding protein
MVHMRWSQFWVGCIGCLGVMTIAGCAESKSTTPATTSGTATSATSPASDSVANLPGCEGAVVPTLATIEKGEYTPLSRPLFIYVNKRALKKPEVAAFTSLS